MTASAHKRRPILRAPAQAKTPAATPAALTGLFAIGAPKINPRRMAEALAVHAKKDHAK